MNVTDYGERNPATPSQHPTAGLCALARRYVDRECPDLADAIFGDAS